MHGIINTIFITVLFLVAKIWKQCECPSIGEESSKLRPLLTPWNIRKLLKRLNCSCTVDLKGFPPENAGRGKRDAEKYMQYDPIFKRKGLNLFKMHECKRVYMDIFI